MTQTVILAGPSQRAFAARLIMKAPDRACVTIKPEKRSDDQNRLMWALLSDVSRAKPGGRMHTPEVWKNLMMHACGHAVQFEMGLNGQPFPVGFRTSRMSKAEMTDLIEFIFSWCAEQDVPIGIQDAA
jgi:hypothetical protein